MQILNANTQKVSLFRSRNFREFSVERLFEDQNTHTHKFDLNELVPSQPYEESSV